ncbi:respiratory nitrate reductase subunit gamma [Streptomyces sp. NPDC055103]
MDTGPRRTKLTPARPAIASRFGGQPVAAIVAGLASTLLGAGVTGDVHDYRETVSVWFRSVFTLQPDIDAMAAAPLSFQLHALIGMLVFAIWPFTRLVHAFTAPVGYLFRPYTVHRSRTTTGTPPRPAPRDWERADRP